MKLNVKGFAFAGGILCALWVAWSVVLSITGIGQVPFDFIDQMYLGWLTPTIGGAVLGAAFGFVDGFVAGAIFAWLYNLIAK
jgi:hypothetical protein